MKRTFVRLAACFSLAAIALASTTAHAEGHGKKRSAFAQSGGNGGGSGGNGNSSGTPSFSRKMSKSFPQMQQGNGSLPNATTSNKSLKFSKNLNRQLDSNLFTNPAFNTNGRSRRTVTGDTLNSSKFADAIQDGKFRPIDSGIGHGIETKPGKLPNGKFKGWDPEKLADVIKDNGKFPSGDGGPDFEQKLGKSRKKKDFLYQKNFPWWMLFVDCYPQDHHHHHHHNHCYPPIYYCYPPTNYTTIINELPPLPAQPVLVQGVDLELVDLRLVDLGDAAKNLAPRYRITFRNRGTLPAGNFQVMLLASNDGTPKPGLPSGVAEVAGAPSGQLLTVDVRLSVTPDLATMNNLIVALDTATQIVETEESNNVAVIDRAKVLMADLAAIPTP